MNQDVISDVLLTGHPTQYAFTYLFRNTCSKKSSLLYRAVEVCHGSHPRSEDEKQHPEVIGTQHHLMSVYFACGTLTVLIYHMATVNVAW
jgi:hypothetical protein